MLIDLVVILFLCLGLIIGWQQGLFKFIKKILPLIGSVAVAAFCCKALADYLFESEAGAFLTEKISGLFGNFSEELNSMIVLKGEHLFLNTSNGEVALTQILENSGFSVFSGTLESIIIRLVAADGDVVFGGAFTMAEAFVPRIALVACYVGSFIALLVTSFIVVLILRRIIGKVIGKVKVFKYIDKFLGSIVWTCLIVFILYGLLAVLKLFAAEPAVLPFMEYIEQSNVAKIMYDNNIFVILLDRVMKSFGLK
ncbi:MAG: hypothetical protein LBQ40_06230 [Clostridiales bacterium]|jgi:hypothetical protein|nr:hypothetical protein [Clostridiales bacterium]